MRSQSVATECVLETTFLPSLAQLLDRVRTEIDGNHETAKALLTRAASLLRVEMDRQASPPERQTGRGGLAAWQIRRLIMFVEARLDRPILIAELSGIAKLSKAHFCRAFKRTFNESPHSYVVRRRLAKAKSLMVTSERPLSEIALHCGFADQAHLCRLFRRHHEQSPAAWRRERTELRGAKANVDDRPPRLLAGLR